MKAARLVNFARTGGHRELAYPGITMGRASDLVAWCAHDNCNFSKRDASAVANRLKVGEPLTVGEYTFLVTAA